MWKTRKRSQYSKLRLNSLHIFGKLNPRPGIFQLTFEMGLVGWQRHFLRDIWYWNISYFATLFIYGLYSRENEKWSKSNPNVSLDLPTSRWRPFWTGFAARLQVDGGEVPDLDAPDNSGSSIKEGFVKDAKQQCKIGRGNVAMVRFKITPNNVRKSGIM